MPGSRIKAQPKQETEPKREAREPQALSTEYHKARKQLMLWAGILLIWELVGVDLEQAKGAEGNIGAIIRAIKSPQAIPWVLLILVAYFLFKFTVEWYQSNAARRGVRVAKVDFLSAWIVALLAYALYFGQTIARVQIADVLQDPTKSLSLLLGFSAAGAILLASLAWLSPRLRIPRIGLQWTLPIFDWKVPVEFVALGGGIVFSIQRLRTLSSVRWTFLLIGAVIAMAAMGCALLVFRPWRYAQRRPVADSAAAKA